MTPKETLDKIANVEYDNKLTADAFLYMADGGMYPYKVEDIAVEACETYAKQETEKYVTVLTAIANLPEDGDYPADLRVHVKTLARKVLNLD